MSALRNFVLAALKVVGRDVSITHHWVAGRKVRLHSYRHKGYWWHGRNREHDAMLAVGRLLQPGDSAIEVGGHIGYLSIWFAHLVGARGSLLVFEPSDENARYLSRNVAPFSWITVDRRGVADREGVAKFFIEGLTGQNNSLLDDYEVFNLNAANAGVEAQRSCVEIELTTLDAVCEQKALHPNFIKIDIEGAEIDALRGMQNVLTTDRPVIFMEITKNAEECFDILVNKGYRAFDPKLEPTTPWVIDKNGERTANSGDFFFIHEQSNRLPA